MEPENAGRELSGWACGLAEKMKAFVAQGEDEVDAGEQGADEVCAQSEHFVGEKPKFVAVGEAADYV
jgi:hypothetical protein